MKANEESRSIIENKRVINLFYGICNGLNYIHEHNLAHRDLKPHNILLSTDRQTPIITDFGRFILKMNVRGFFEKPNTFIVFSVINSWISNSCNFLYWYFNRLNDRKSNWSKKLEDSSRASRMGRIKLFHVLQAWFISNIIPWHMTKKLIFSDDSWWKLFKTNTLP